MCSHLLLDTAELTQGTYQASLVLTKLFVHSLYPCLNNWSILLCKYQDSIKLLSENPQGKIQALVKSISILLLTLLESGCDQRPFCLNGQGR